MRVACVASGRESAAGAWRRWWAVCFEDPGEAGRPLEHTWAEWRASPGRLPNAPPERPMPDRAPRRRPGRGRSWTHEPSSAPGSVGLATNTVLSGWKAIHANQ